jgi:hypothetical protein
MFLNNGILYSKIIKILKEHNFSTSIPIIILIGPNPDFHGFLIPTQEISSKTIL